MKSVFTDNTYDFVFSDWLRQLHTSYLKFNYMQSIMTSYTFSETLIKTKF